MLARPYLRSFSLLAFFFFFCLWSTENPLINAADYADRPETLVFCAYQY